MATGTNNRTTTTQLNKTTQQNQVTVCKRCKAPHFQYQLSCKRCGEYFNPEDAPAGGNAAMNIVAAIAVAAIIIGACKYLNLF